MVDENSPISWQDFMRIDLRVGRVVSANAFPEARKPAYILEVDFGEDTGVPVGCRLM